MKAPEINLVEMIDELMMADEEVVNAHLMVVAGDISHIILLDKARHYKGVEYTTPLDTFYGSQMAVYTAGEDGPSVSIEVSKASVAVARLMNAGLKYKEINKTFYLHCMAYAKAVLKFALSW